MRRQPVLPTARAAIFTAVCVGLGAGAHLWMSGAPIPPWAVMVGAAAVYAAARLSARRERSLSFITVLMAGTQELLHLLFSFAQNLAATAANTVVSANAVIVRLPSTGLPGATGGGGANTAALDTSMPGMDMGPAAPSYVAGAMHMGPGMLMAHIGAALISSWWLRRGEAAVHRLVRVVARWMRRCVVPHMPTRRFAAAPSVAQRIAIVVPRLIGSEFEHAVTRRGPPAPLTPCT